MSIEVEGAASAVPTLNPKSVIVERSGGSENESFKGAKVLANGLIVLGVNSQCVES
jgi:hypothetical protein